MPQNEVLGLEPESRPKTKHDRAAATSNLRTAIITADRYIIGRSSASPHESISRKGQHRNRYPHCGHSLNQTGEDLAFG